MNEFVINKNTDFVVFTGGIPALMYRIPHIITKEKGK